MHYGDLVVSEALACFSRNEPSNQPFGCIEHKYLYRGSSVGIVMVPIPRRSLSLIVGK